MVGGRAVGDVEIAPEASSSGSTHTRCTRHASDDSDGVWQPMDHATCRNDRQLAQPTLSSVDRHRDVPTVSAHLLRTLLAP